MTIIMYNKIWIETKNRTIRQILYFFDIKNWKFLLFWSYKFVATYVNMFNDSEIITEYLIRTCSLNVS